MIYVGFLGTRVKPLTVSLVKSRQLTAILSLSLSGFVNSGLFKSNLVVDH
jgi:hypothetical protein